MKESNSLENIFHIESKKRLFLLFIDLPIQSLLTI